MKRLSSGGLSIFLAVVIGLGLTLSGITNGWLLSDVYIR